MCFDYTKSQTGTQLMSTCEEWDARFPGTAQEKNLGFFMSSPAKKIIH